MIEFLNTLLHHITKYQQEFQSIIASNFRAIKEENSLLSIATILGISLIYGIVHALGPGHGKALVAGYFLGNNHSYKKAFKMGYLISFIHALSALSITFFVYYLLTVIFSKTFHDTSIYMTKASGVLIIAIGIYLFFEHHKEKDINSPSDKSDLAVAFGAGIVPCPGVMTVVLFSIMMGKIAVGVIAAILMSIGMGLTISLSAILATAARKRTNKTISNIFPCIGNSMIILLGLYLIIQ